MPAKLQASNDKIKAAIFAGRILPSMNFVEKVWAICARIPEGKVVTYGDIAAKLDSKGYRAVGMAMNRNPYSPDVPCHRVVGSTGKLTGYAGGLDKKAKILKQEKVPMVSEGTVDLIKARHQL
jgi:methylated-DNA-[protein]-cysteine S-methyltransferase